jgi:hypothetical protein
LKNNTKCKITAWVMITCFVVFFQLHLTFRISKTIPSRHSAHREHSPLPHPSRSLLYISISRGLQSLYGVHCVSSTANSQDTQLQPLCEGQLTSYHWGLQ